MSCIFCGFENPDSEEHCFRCGRSLDTETIDVIPYRLKRGPSPHLGWQSTQADFRRRRALRRYRAQAAQVYSPEPGLFSSPAWFYGLLSLFPGLGQVAAERTRRGGVCLGLWLLGVMGSLIWNPPPYWSLPAAGFWLSLPNPWIMGLHITIMLDAYRVAPGKPGPLVQSLQMLALAAASWGFLTLGRGFFASDAPFRTYEIRFGALNHALLCPGDLVAVWDLAADRQSLPLGMTITYTPRLTEEQSGMRHAINGELPGTLEGLPGEVISYSLQHLWVQDRKLATPDWLEGAMGGRRIQDRKLGPDEYLVVPPIPLLQVDSWEAFVVRRQDIRGVVTDILDPGPRRQRLRVR